MYDDGDGAAVAAPRIPLAALNLGGLGAAEYRGYVGRLESPQGPAVVPISG